MTEVWPTTNRRSCFWHLKQSILRWNWDALDKKAAPSSPKSLRESLVAQFTVICRARTVNDKDKLAEAFLQTGIASSVANHCDS